MLDHRWRDAIDAFLRHEQAGGKSPMTLQARRDQLEHLARYTTLGGHASI